MQHFCPPIGRVFSALHKPLGLKKVDEPDQKRPFDTQLLGQYTLPSTFTSTRQD